MVNAKRVYIANEKLEYIGELFEHHKCGVKFLFPRNNLLCYLFMTSSNIANNELPVDGMYSPLSGHSTLNRLQSAGSNRPISWDVQSAPIGWWKQSANRLWKNMAMVVCNCEGMNREAPRRVVDVKIV